MELYPHIPIQNDSYNYGVYRLKYITMLYLYHQWDFLDDTGSEIVRDLSAIMKFWNLGNIFFTRFDQGMYQIIGQ